MTLSNVDLHDRHDRNLISAAVAGDVIGTELERAEALIRGCSNCADLAADLRAIAAATRVLPAVARPAALDFRLTLDTAHRLGRGNGWWRLVRPFIAGSAARPLAAALTTLGVVGLLLTVVPFAQLGGSTGSFAGAPSQDETRMVAPAQVPESHPSLAVDNELGTSGSGADSTSGAPEVQAPAPDDKAAGTDRDDGSATGPSPLTVLSVWLLGAGLGLFALRRIARRLG